MILYWKLRQSVQNLIGLMKEKSQQSKSQVSQWQHVLCDPQNVSRAPLITLQIINIAEITSKVLIILRTFLISDGAHLWRIGRGRVSGTPLWWQETKWQKGGDLSQDIQRQIGNDSSTQVWFCLNKENCRHLIHWCPNIRVHLQNDFLSGWNFSFIQPQR